MIAISIGVVILVAVTYFVRNIFIFNLSSQASLTAQIESRKILKNMVAELRSASPSALGAYAIESAATSSIIFFADVNGDDNADRVHFYIDLPTRTIKRGIVLASGAPPSYNLGSETVTTLMSDISNATSAPLFEYFDENYTGITAPLTYPLDLSSIRMVRVTAKIDKDIRSPLTLTFISSALLRNLKENL